MKKNYLFLLFLIAFSFNSYSQITASEDYSYEVSEPYEVIDGYKKYFVHQDKMVSIKMRKKSIYIQQFDTKSLKELIRKEYDEKDILPDNYHPEGMKQLQNKIYFFYSSWSGRKTQRERLYYLTIDVNTAKIIGEPVQVADVEGKLAGSFLTLVSVMGIPFSMATVDKFDILTSEDSTKILIQYRKKPEVKRDTKSHDIIGVNVYNSDMTPIWNKEFKMPYTERRMDLLDFAVDNEGRGYILSKVFKDDSNEDKKKKRDEQANYHIELFRLLQGQSDIAKTKIELDGIFINGISLFESKNNQLFCASYYNKGLLKGNFISKKHNKSSADGIVIFKLSKEGEVLKTYTQEIPLEVINMYISDRAKEKNKDKEEEGEAELQNMVLRDLIIHNDGSLTMVGEQYFMVEHRTQKSVYYTYHYYNILITKINPDGTLAWMNKIPKKQIGKKGIGGMSYTYLSTSSYHYLLFLDNVKNMELPKNEFPHKHSDGKGGYFTSYKINDVSGEVTKGSVFDTRNLTEDFNAHQFSTNRVIKISDSAFIVEVYKKKKEDVLVKISVK
ncbi:hypothetical protein [Xanthomarina sp. F2636L]|uniref:hypothetical protein n=1 Tax=Xanthomarina sp. F2636L TaxID=2996018 RepID=UPI00225E2EBC|nr:hypothetical protein [Xanthomarina sp. F2636L]MCX7551480.1 hypothetical protein [Xanthomarina sp. F2636L]